MEAIKILAGLGEPLLGKMLVADLGSMEFRKVQLERRLDCTVCATV
jgi:molybdopterin/thiamine biosynthesis adenylyltransferase